MQFARKDILDIGSLSVEEINMVLDTAVQMKEISQRPIKKVPTLRGKNVILFFQEPSTRTRTSFDIAGKRLSADTFSISASTSSSPGAVARISATMPNSSMLAWVAEREDVAVVKQTG